MKKVILSAQFNARDNFKVGDCTNCPISIQQYEEIYFGSGTFKYICPIKCNPINCPMEVESEVKE